MHPAEIVGRRVGAAYARAILQQLEAIERGITPAAAPADAGDRSDPRPQARQPAQRQAALPPQGGAAPADAGKPPAMAERSIGAYLRGGTANYMRGQHGGVGQNMTTIGTASGKRVMVNRAAAPAFKGFLDEIEGAGAPIRSIGGYNPRFIAGTRRLSQHAFGNAIDIDQHARNVVSRPFADWARANPDKLRAAINRWGMVSGGDWRRPDFGHFEWSGRKPQQAVEGK